MLSFVVVERLTPPLFDILRVMIGVLDTLVIADEELVIDDEPLSEFVIDTDLLILGLCEVVVV